MKSARARKFVGMLGLLAFMAFWIWGAVGLGALLPAAWFVQLPYYVVAGTVWAFPLIPLVKWMNRGA